MKCPKCNSEIADGSKFCPNCGYSFTPSVPPATAKKNSGLSIAAFILSFFGIIGTILGVVDLFTDTAKKHRHTLSVIAIVIGIVITAAIFGSSRNGNRIAPKQAPVSDESQADAAKSVTSGSGSITESVSVESNSAVGSSAASDEKTYLKGEEYNDGRISLTMTDCGIASSDQISQYADVKSGTRIVYASFDAKNIGSDSASVMYTDFSGYADDAACDQFYSLDDSMGKCGMNFMDNLSAGRSISGVVAFSVPDDATEFQIEYKPNMLLAKVIIFDVPLQ